MSKKKKKQKKKKGSQKPAETESRPAEPQLEAEAKAESEEQREFETVMTGDGSAVTVRKPAEGEGRGGRLNGFFRTWPAWKVTAALILGLLLFYVPFAGSYGLWDPWETHYGEVSRSILQRQDVISPFWQDNWFFSKPIGTMWLQAGGMRVLGVNRLGGDESEMALSTRPEWGMRLPIILLSILALWALYAMALKFLNRRVALIGTIICATAPMYALITRQSITDIPLVGPMTAGLAFFMLGIFSDENEPAPVHRRLRSWMLVPAAAAFMLIVWPGQDPASLIYIPGVLGLLHLAAAGLSAWVMLKVGPGSGPEEPADAARAKMWRAYWMLLGVQAVLAALGVAVWGTTAVPWSVVMGAAVAFGGWELARGRRLDITTWHIFGLVLVLCTWPQFIAFSTLIGDAYALFLPLGKGRRLNLQGWIFMLPWIGLWLTYVFSCRAAQLRSARKVYLHAAWMLCGLSVLGKGLGGLAIPIAVVGLFVLVTRRWRLLMNLELARGVAVWFAVAAPWHHAMWVRHKKDFWNLYFGHHHFKRAQVGVHGDRGSFDYFIHQLGFGMFPWSALLPAALVRLVGRPTAADRKGQVQIFLLVWAAVNFALFAMMETKFHHYILPAIPPLAVLIAVWLDELPERKDAGAVVAVVASVGLLLIMGRDLYRDPQHLVLMFIYKYDRLFPYELKFENWLAALTVISAVPMVLLAIRPVRRYAIWGLAAAGIVTGLWTIDHYLVKLSPHWGQKELHAAYYRSRKGPQERLIAWQLNWRGENYYSKNRVVVHMQPKETKKFQAYLRRYKGWTFYLILEQSRLSTLKRTLPTQNAKDTLEIVGPDGRAWPDEWVKHFRVKRYRVLKKPYVCNKFLLVRTTI